MLIKFDAANRTKAIALLVVVVFALAAPSFLSPYLFYLFTILLINVIVMVSFRFISLMGAFSFVHPGLWSVGAYATAVLTTKLGLPFWVGIPVAGLVAAVCGLAIGIPCLRARGIYFLIITFACFEALRQVWIRFKDLFGGHLGLYNIPTPEEVPYYYLVLGLTVLSLVIMYRIENSRVGDTIKSIALDESLAESVGIHTWKYRVLTFVIGSLFVGLAGALYAHKVGTITPTDFTFYTLLNIIVASFLGGIGNFFGPIFGIFLITLINYLGKDLLDWLPLVLGCIMIVIILFLPGGLVSLPQLISTWRQEQKRKRSLTEERKSLIKRLFNIT